MDHGARTDTLARLAELERELREVRRELTSERTKAPPPRGLFQVVRVLVGESEYAVTSVAVRDIVRYARLTSIPGTLAAVRGALNLRGERVPVLNLPRLLGASDSRPDLKTAIVIVEAHGRLVGLLVDGVIDVTTLDGALLDGADGSLDRSRFIAAVSCTSSRILQLLDLAELVSPTEIALFEAELAESLRRVRSSDPQLGESDDEGDFV